MIDFHGPSSSGKTLYLYAIIISTILPKSWKYSRSKPAVPLSGKARSVIFVDMDQGFSASRLKTLLCLEIVSRIEELNESRVAKEHGTSREPNPNLEKGEPDPGSSKEAQRYDIDPETPEMQAKIEQLVVSCLRNVHVFRPPDAISTIVMLRTMDQYLFNISSGPIISVATTGVGSGSRTEGASGGTHPSPPFALLILDSLSSFFWQERAQTNHSRFMTVLVDALNRLVSRWKLVYVSTTWSLPSLYSTTDRTVTDALRARLKFRFLMQPRTLERFRTQEDLLHEWSRRQVYRGRVGQRGSDELQKDKASTTDLEDGTGSLFQAQMVIPSTQDSRQDVFRFSISNTRGIRSFSVPPILYHHGQGNSLGSTST